MTRQTLEQRFWAKVDRCGPNDCWKWTAARDSEGYGQFWDPARRTMGLAHRFAYDRFVIPLAPKSPGVFGAYGETVCHRCDNPPCVNPAHLFLATHAQNIADMRAKGRQPDNAGERNPRARLTAEQAAAARESYTGAYGEIAALARQYGVSHSAMWSVVHGQSWA